MIPSNKGTNKKIHHARAGNLGTYFFLERFLILVGWGSFLPKRPGSFIIR